MEARIRREGAVEAGKRGMIRCWFRLFRVHQWSKNMLIFVPLVLSQSYFDWHALVSAFCCFLAMCLAASGVYVVNDVVDVGADRRHPTKRLRPIASGDVKASVALAVALPLIVSGLVVSAIVSPGTGAVVGLYVAASLAYSFVFKRIAMADIFVLASLYVVRVLAGLTAIGAAFSHWLLMFSFFFFFSLAMAKRHVELVNIGGRIDAHGLVEGRGYHPDDAPLTLVTGVSAMMVSVLILSLYVANDIYPKQIYSHPQWLWGVVAIMMAWTTRIWLLSHRGELADDPVSFAVTDWISLLLGLAAAGFFALSVT